MSAEKREGARASLKDLFAAGVAAYTGFKVKELEVHADPEVSGTYALRAIVGRAFGDVRLDFLIVGNHVEGGLRNADAETIAENLEECEFTVWPPRSGAPRFF